MREITAREKDLINKFSSKLMNRPTITQDYSKLIVVYSHWKDEQCIYIGSGKLKRAYEKYEYQRNWKWFELVDEEFDKVYVRIEKFFDSRDEAYEYEESLTWSMLNKGYTLANKYYGRKMNEESKNAMIESLKGKMVGEKNPFYNRQHTQKSIDKMLKNMPSLSGENHHSYGRQLSDDHKRKLSKSKSGSRDLIEVTYSDGSKERFDGYAYVGKLLHINPNNIRKNVKQHGFYKSERLNIEFRMITPGDKRPYGDSLPSTQKRWREANKYRYDQIEVTHPDGQSTIAYGYSEAVKGYKTCNKKLKRMLEQTPDRTWKDERNGVAYKFIKKGESKK